MLATEPHLPQGATFDQEFISSKHFIDKTSLLKEFFSNITRVFVTAPQGFGKTTNLKMIEKFTQIEFDDKGNPPPEPQSTIRDLFKSLKIGQNEATMTHHLSQHPVIFFDMAFRIDGGITKDKILQAYSVQLNETYSKYKWIIDQHSSNPKLEKYQAEQQIMKKVATEVLDVNEIKHGIRHLATLLNAYFGKTVVLLIDNYDAIVHDLIIDSNGCLDHVYSIFEEIISKCYQNDSQVIEYTFIASTTTIGFQCFGLHRFFRQFYFYNNHTFMPYFGLGETEVDDLNKKYDRDDISSIPTIQKYCGGYQIKNINVTICNTSCVIDYLETNDNSAWISQQMPTEPTKFIWKLLKMPEYLDQVSRLIKFSIIRHGRFDLLPFTNFTNVVRDDFNEPKFPSGVNSSTFSYMLQTGFLSPLHDRNNYIIPNLRIRNQFMTDLLYYYEKISNIDFKSIGIRLGEFFNPDKNYTVPRINLMECLNTSFAGVKPIYSPRAQNTTNRMPIAGKLEFVYQSIIHLGALTNHEIQVIEDFPLPVSYEKSTRNTVIRAVTCCEKDKVALVIKSSDVYDLETLMNHGHKYGIEKREDLNLVVYLAIRIEPDKRILIDVMTSTFTDEITGNTTYHYITSMTRKTRPPKPKKNKTITKQMQRQTTADLWY